MITYRDRLLADLVRIISNTGDPTVSLGLIGDLLRNGGGYRWVGPYDVDQAAGIVRNTVWSGPSGPDYLTFPITKGLTGAAVARCKTVNAGDVCSDPRYITVLSTTRSEIIVPMFDSARQTVIGTTDVESEMVQAFSTEEQRLLETCAEVIRPLWLR